MTSSDAKPPWEVSGTPKCLSCEYELTHAAVVGPAGVCPECGSAFNLNNPAHFREAMTSAEMRRRMCRPAAIAVFVALICAVPGVGQVVFGAAIYTGGLAAFVPLYLAFAWPMRVALSVRRTRSRLRPSNAEIGRSLVFAYAWLVAACGLAGVILIFATE